MGDLFTQLNGQFAQDDLDFLVFFDQKIFARSGELVLGGNGESGDKGFATQFGNKGVYNDGLFGTTQPQTFGCRQICELLNRGHAGS